MGRQDVKVILTQGLAVQHGRLVIGAQDRRRVELGPYEQATTDLDGIEQVVRVDAGTAAAVRMGGYAAAEERESA